MPAFESAPKKTIAPISYDLWRGLSDLEGGTEARLMIYTGYLMSLLFLLMSHYWLCARPDVMFSVQ